MKIVHVAPIEESVPPQKYGGVERVVAGLIKEQDQSGHEVHLIGTSDSVVEAQLHGFMPALRNIYQSDADLAAARDYYKYRYPFYVVQKLKEINPDIIHNHYGWRIMITHELLSNPMVTTSHGPLTDDATQKAFSEASYQNYVSISHNQRKAMPDINWVNTVYNGVDTDIYQPKKANQKKDYLAFLGRISPQKGLFEICQQIKKSSHRLKIAAKIDPVDAKYYESQIKPLIDGKQIEYIGELADQEKAKFLQAAKGLLLWLNWEEPFGLVVVEAMACGTPVIVNKRGSMKELVRNGVNGYLIDEPEEFNPAIEKLSQIQSQDCVNWVRAKFSNEVMAHNYLKVYERVIDASLKPQNHLGETKFPSWTTSPNLPI